MSEAELRELVRSMRAALILVRARLGAWCPITDCEDALECWHLRDPDDAAPCRLDALVAEAKRIEGES